MKHMYLSLLLCVTSSSMAMETVSREEEVWITYETEYGRMEYQSSRKNIAQDLDNLSTYDWVVKGLIMRHKEKKIKTLCSDGIPRFETIFFEHSIEQTMSPTDAIKAVDEFFAPHTNQ